MFFYKQYIINPKNYYKYYFSNLNNIIFSKSSKSKLIN